MRVELVKDRTLDQWQVYLISYAQEVQQAGYAGETGRLVWQRVAEAEAFDNVPPFLVARPQEVVELFRGVLDVAQAEGIIPDRTRELEAELEGVRGELRLAHKIIQRFFALLIPGAAEEARQRVGGEVDYTVPTPDLLEGRYREAQVNPTPELLGGGATQAQLRRR